VIEIVLNQSLVCKGRFFDVGRHRVDPKMAQMIAVSLPPGAVVVKKGAIPDEDLHPASFKAGLKETQERARAFLDDPIKLLHGCPQIPDESRAMVAATPDELAAALSNGVCDSYLFALGALFWIGGDESRAGLVCERALALARAGGG
jgi:hypothetical protein